MTHRTAFRHLMTLVALVMCPPPAIAFSFPPPCSLHAGRFANQQAEPRLEELTIDDETFKLEVAADEPARERGLMHRTELAPDRGMIFIFPDLDQRSFWMKNCRMDIDLLFLDDQGRIVARHEMKKEHPRRTHETEDYYESRLKCYRSHRPARFALELQPGTIQRLKLSTGDRIDIDFDRLRKLAK